MSNLMLYGPKFGGKARRVKVRRFCIDDDAQREQFEKLASAAAAGEVKFVKEPTEVYSQKTDKFYLVVQWYEKE
jgi:hypothetical protein